MRLGNTRDWLLNSTQLKTRRNGADWNVRLRIPIDCLGDDDDDDDDDDDNDDDDDDGADND